MVQFNVFLFLAGFARTLFVIVIIYYLIKLVTRFVLPLIVNQPEPQKNFRNTHQSRPEGEVTIERDRTSGSKTSKNEGEYVDFEEID